MKKDEMITEQAKEISQLEELLDKAGTLISNWLRDDEPPNDRDADDIENEIASQQISRQARDTWKIEEEPIDKVQDRLNRACELIDSMESLIDTLPGVMTEDLNNRIQAFFNEIKYSDELDTEMKFLENNNHQPGTCPLCSSDDLDYDGCNFGVDNQIYYKWTCNSCGSTGQEWYSTTFINHENIVVGEPS